MQADEHRREQPDPSRNWAVKTAFHVELALRLQHSGARPVEGYAASEARLRRLLLDRSRDHLDAGVDVA